MCIKYSSFGGFTVARLARNIVGLPTSPHCNPRTLNTVAFIGSFMDHKKKFALSSFPDVKGTDTTTQNMNLDNHTDGKIACRTG